MKQFDDDFEALKSMTRLAWELDLTPSPAMPPPPVPLKSDA